MKIVSWLVLFFSISPIWPLGQNPLPGDPFVIINKQTNQLAFYEHELEILHFPVATGKMPVDTPEGLFTIVVKAPYPYYRKANIPGKDPNNPLGTRWIGFDARNTDGRIYGIHGTNQEEMVGKYVSNGCIRLTNKNVERLFELVPLGTRLYIYSGKDSFQSIAEEFGAKEKALLLQH